MTWILPDIVPNFPLEKPLDWDVVPHTTLPGGEDAGVMEVRVGTYHSSQNPSPVQAARKWVILQSKDYRFTHAYDLNERRVWARVLVELWEDTGGVGMDNFEIPEAFLERHYSYFVRVPDFPHAVQRWNVVYQPLQTVQPKFDLGPSMDPARTHTWQWLFEGSINLIKKENLPTPVEEGEEVDEEMGTLDGVVFVGFKTSFPVGGPAYNGGCYYQWTARDTNAVEPNVDGMLNTPGDEQIANGLDVAQIKDSANWNKDVCTAENPLCDVNLDGKINGMDVAQITSSGVWGR